MNANGTVSACVIIVHFGSLPEWFPLWLATARENRDVDFLVYSEVKPAVLADNVLWRHLSLVKFNSLQSVVDLGFKLSKPYKLCDFRPAFARIFADDIQGYDYWGWGDLDVRYGNIRGLLSESFGVYDFVATGWDGQSGPLAFLRNCSKVNELFLGLDGYQEKINDLESHGLDEIDFLELLKRNVSCDIVFRECLHDLPARLQNGHLISMVSGREYVLYHFGGRYSGARKGIIKRVSRLEKCVESGDAIHVRPSGGIREGDGWVSDLPRKIRNRLFRFGK